MTKPRVEAGDRALAFLESEAFYDAMQTYRHMSVGRQAEVVEAFEAVKKLIQSAMNAQERKLNAAIGILARLPWCECGHQHVGAEMCMGCDCFQQIPVSREWLVEKVKSLAERGVTK